MTAENEMLQQIFRATEKLIAQYGVHQISMQKIAKEAGIAAGTIYIYFKSKEELLQRLAFDLFQRFQTCVNKGINPDLPLFQQYRQMWWNLWHWLHANPQVILTMNQYRALPDFYDIIEECLNITDDAWHCLTEKGKQSGEISDLHPDILFSLSLESAINMAEKDLHLRMKSNAQDLEKIIQHSWNAILPLS
ncbi:TetR/AcrR family transcriptional regulator [Gallibacterium anatis]|nr:TetR/AcrR family transcriptional regulator [Gallibacterium anatis]KGQ24727.1 transcriptional regulator BetI [Gallibacterium anatis]